LLGKAKKSISAKNESIFYPSNPKLTAIIRNLAEFS